MGINSANISFENAAIADNLTFAAPISPPSPDAISRVRTAYEIIIKTAFGKWLFDNPRHLAFIRSEDMAQGFAPYSAEMQTVMNLLLGVTISEKFKQVISDATRRSFQAVFTDFSIRKNIINWPDKPEWDAVRELAQRAEDIFSDSYEIAEHKIQPKKIRSIEKPAVKTATTTYITRASTGGKDIAINMHPDAWPAHRTPVDIVGDVLHEHHHCLQSALVESHRARKIPHHHDLYPDIELLSASGWVDVMTRKLSTSWYAAQVCEKDTHFLSDIFQECVKDAGGADAIKKNAALSWREHTAYWWQRFRAPDSHTNKINA